MISNCNKEGGMVLITTIMFLILLALVVLSQLQMIFLYYKGLNQLIEKHQSFYQLEAEGNKLAGSEQTACLINEKNDNEVIELLKNKQGCVVIHDKQRYYYLIEKLGVFPCLQNQFGHLRYSTFHWRISITAEKTPAFLQLRMAKRVKLVSCKTNEPHQIKIGLLSWRYL